MQIEDPATGSQFPVFGKYSISGDTDLQSNSGSRLIFILAWMTEAKCEIRSPTDPTGSLIPLFKSFNLELLQSSLNKDLILQSTKKSN